jgi:hypothetical protein
VYCYNGGGEGREHNNDDQDDDDEVYHTSSQCGRSSEVKHQEEQGEDATSDRDDSSPSETVNEDEKDEDDDDDDDDDAEDNADNDDDALLDAADDDDEVGEEEEDRNDEEEDDEEEVEVADLMVDYDDPADADDGIVAVAASRPSKKPRRFRRGIDGRTAGSGKARKGSSGGGGSKLFRMRNFRSVRMTERHGDALASFACGNHGEAIAKLQMVARDLPSAPQVYASLAVVYEEMLSELEKSPPTRSSSSLQREEQSLPALAANGQTQLPLQNRKPPTSDPNGASNNADVTDSCHGNSDQADRGEDDGLDDQELTVRWLSEKLTVAKKAYGAYHIAALLCKRDFSFWVRAGDMAATVADLHSQFMKVATTAAASLTAGMMTQAAAAAAAPAGSPSPEDNHREHHRGEKRRWLAEAKNDYKAADNIKPPGIDIPAKLAAVCVELGCLPEALTLLTDLKNRRSRALDASEHQRSEFESSYKAWLLYADLMLRLGYECTRWNDGDQTIGNVSSRRWLRRHSETFDWEERRLQALGKALEAAAGSVSCRRVTDWLKRRARATTMDRSNGSTGRNVAPDSEDPFESEKALLFEKNANELADFDRTTSELEAESGGAPTAQRKAARSRLIAFHDSAFRELESEFGRRTELTERSDSFLESAEMPSLQGDADGPPLAVSASTTTVCSIASELMKHLLRLNSYDGGSLVAEAVSFYLKHRADLQHRRARSRRKLDETNCLLDSVLRGEPTEYVELDVSDEDSVAVLSDDDDLESGGPRVVESMRRGILPPDLNVLLSLCLLGERGRDFVAFKCLQSIDSLEQESVSYLLEAEIDDGVSYDSSWTVFKRLMTGMLRRTEALALVQRTLRDCGRDAELHGRLLPLFEAQVRRLQDLKIVSIDTSVSLSLESLSVVHEVATASARFQLQSAETLSLQSNSVEANILLRRSAQTLSMIIRDMWTKRPEDTVPPQCIEALETLVSVFKFRLSLPESSSVDQDIDAWVVLIEQSVSTLCGYSAPQPTSAEAMPNISNLPIHADWLSTTRKAIALRAYNLAVSLNVARFSGWEDTEFRMELMRRRSNSSSYFGITMSDGMVSGLLDQHEGDILDQWDVVQEVLNQKPALSLRRLLEERKSSSWYRDATESYEKSRRGHRIAAQGEDFGLFILLSFSRACILSARKSKDTNRQSSLVLNALSVLLPLLQFVLKAVVWDAAMGIVSETRANVLDWRSSASNDEKKEDGSLQRKRTRKRNVPMAKEETRNLVALHNSFAGERAGPIISNLVVVRSESFLQVWANSPLPEPPLTKASLDELSRTVWRNVQQLRLCHTAGAAELASLNVAVAMLDLLSHQRCRNPFHCLHMASLFASQGPKLGSSDKPFRAALPKIGDCNPLEALMILGRAGCLQALHFCTEAAFLCDFVASVCHFRLSNELSGSHAPGRWNVIRAVAYNTSVSIRHTASLLSKDADKRSDSVVWKWRNETVDELLRGREDSLNLIGIGRASEASLPREPLARTTTNDVAPFALSNGTKSSPDKFMHPNQSDAASAINDGGSDFSGLEVVGV